MTDAWLGDWDGILGNQAIGAALIKNPAEISKLLKEHVCNESVLRATQHAPELFNEEKLGVKRIVESIMRLDSALRAYSSDHNVLSDAEEKIFSNAELVAELLKNPDRTVSNIMEFAKDIGKHRGDELRLFNGPFGYEIGTDPAKAARTVKELMKILPNEEGNALDMLRGDGSHYIIEAYLKEPGKILSALRKICKSLGYESYSIYQLGQINYAEKFAKYPDIFVRMANEFSGESMFYALQPFVDDPKRFKELLGDPGKSIAIVKEIRGISPDDFYCALQLLEAAPMAALFSKDRQRAFAVIRKIAKNSGMYFGSAASAISDDQEMLAKYLGGKINDNDFFFKIRTSSNYAIELGRPLDYYHDNEPERLGYLSKLSKDDVLALLMSDPNFFYTSSNNLLFDRLMKDFAGRNISDVIQAHKMKGTQQELNLFFRAMNYDRLCGHDNSIFQSSELQKIFSQMAS